MFIGKLPDDFVLYFLYMMLFRYYFLLPRVYLVLSLYRYLLIFSFWVFSSNFLESIWMFVLQKKSFFGLYNNVCSVCTYDKSCLGELVATLVVITGTCSSIGGYFLCCWFFSRYAIETISRFSLKSVFFPFTISST